MSAPRWPAVLLVVVLLGAMVAVDRLAEEQSVPALDDVARAVHPMALAQPAGASLSSFYCPVAVSTPAPPDADTEATDAEATDEATGVDPEARGPMVERTVLLVTNVGDEDRTGRLEIFDAGGSVHVEEVVIEAASRWQRNLGEHVEVGPAAALLEVDGGGVAAAVLASGPQGATVSTCPSQPSTEWYFPTAATTLDARAVLQIFNPFPVDAILEITFYDAEGPRIPTGFEAFPVSRNSVVAVEVTDLVTVRPQVATSIRARSGQVVAGLVQTYDGTADAEGLAVMAGAPRPAETWFFPAGRWNDDARETIIVFNPGDVDARIDITVALDDPAVTGAVAPFEHTVPRRGFTVVGSHQDEWARVPPGVGHSISVRSQNDEPVVAAQRLTVVGGANAGTAVALGSPLWATEWILPTVDLQDSVGSVTVLNPSPESLSRVTPWGVAEGEQIELAPLEIAPTERSVLSLREDIDRDRSGGRTDASGPVVVSSAAAFTDAGGRAWWLGVPVEGTTIVPQALQGGG
jgi:hypothetical protein